MTRLLPLTLLLVACGDDPQSYSAPVAINLKAKSGDVSGTVISDEKGITTESGNPYGAFVSDATRTIGRAPRAVEVDQLTLVLGAGSTGVTALEQIFTGDLDVAFIMNDSDNTYDVGHVIDPTGLGPVGIDINFESDAVPADDYTRYLNGSFKVVIRGTAATDFATKGADADLQVTFTFAAFE